ncbi:hypothetical protein ASPCADRAFT_210413 [Aspergillus carbonarius ITEM 5010]|uniref:Uncharacterized protein n=1 Tax=Aspergillus carbonarius (strain ITEM 5010) TaxID=602072 RepID=A0A1R3RDF6_ASPC5|nr:hypothetical protein ASPCADRAFT_210413 [Aspergillus carbonarius ITEM 5010]
MSKNRENPLGLARQWGRARGSVGRDEQGVLPNRGSAQAVPEAGCTIGFVFFIPLLSVYSTD